MACNSFWVGCLKRKVYNYIHTVLFLCIITLFVTLVAFFNKLLFTYNFIFLLDLHKNLYNSDVVFCMLCYESELCSIC